MADVNVLIGSPESFFVDDASVPCENCGRMCYIRPYNIPGKGDKIRVLCITCTRSIIKSDDTILYNKSVEEELLQWGVSREDIVRMRRRIEEDLKKKRGAGSA